MGNRKQVKFETLRSLAGASISGTYAAVGVPTVYSSRMIVIVNKTDGDVIISTDGTNNMMYIPTGLSRIYDFGANRCMEDDSFYIAAHTQFYAKQGTTTSSGTLYIECIYGLQGVP